jgi:hypothetical protein
MVEYCIILFQSHLKFPQKNEDVFEVFQCFQLIMFFTGTLENGSIQII